MHESAENPALLVFIRGQEVVQWGLPARSAVQEHDQGRANHVTCPLPLLALRALSECLRDESAYFSDRAMLAWHPWPATGIASWRNSSRLAGIPNGHPHRFRDTFAVEQLLFGHAD